MISMDMKVSQTQTCTHSPTEDEIKLNMYETSLRASVPTLFAHIDEKIKSNDTSPGIGDNFCDLLESGSLIVQDVDSQDLDILRYCSPKKHRKGLSHDQGNFVKTHSESIDLISKDVDLDYCQLLDRNYNNE